MAAGADSSARHGNGCDVIMLPGPLAPPGWLIRNLAKKFLRPLQASPGGLPPPQTPRLAPPARA
eukprot:630609-Alexandrium_andersonii.AAC.1